MISRYVLGLAALGMVCVVGSPVLAADTLVVKKADGSFGPGAAKAWQAAETSVVFELAEGQDASALAAYLGERLANVDINVDGGKLVISGIPPAALLDQLSALSLTAGGDPLADLTGLGGGVVAMEAPEGGGSIRASKPSGKSARPRAIAAHDAAERLEAEVVEVKRGSFHSVTLKLRVQRSAKAGPLRAKLRRGKVIEAPVVYAVTDKGLELDQEANKRNLAAWYLAQGDRVIVHAVAAEGDALELDFVSRR